MALRENLILRSPRSGRLEGRRVVSPAVSRRSERRLAASQRAVRQDHDLAAAAALLRADEGELDLLDWVARVDRRLQHTITQLCGQIGIKLPHLLRRALRQAAAEIEAGPADRAETHRRAAHRRILARHRP